MSKFFKKYWYYFVLIFTALFINEDAVHVIVAMVVGKLTVTDSISEVFKYFNWSGYSLTLKFRLVPYIALSIVLLIIGRTKKRHLFNPTFVGGLIGILGFMLPSMWLVLRPLYTAEHVSSTSPIAFLFIPIYCVPTMILGVLLGNFAFVLIRYYSNKKIT